ncbi:MAG: ELWxxDGT repeat protein, partial [Planctomycetota bacterium]
MTNLNGILYFSASDATNGRELWKSDGTNAGTVLVKDINIGSGDSYPVLRSNLDGILYFTANAGIKGLELWKSDGSSAGTVLVKDIRSGVGSSSPDINLVNVNGTLYFSANDGTNGIELWQSDGTSAGTVIVKDIRNGIASSTPSNFTNLNGTLYFTANDGANGTELWKLSQEPNLQWAAPASITYGTALSATQLNATAAVPGTFSYSPALGTVLNAGLGQNISVTFTPTDLVNYGTDTITVGLNVHKATLTVSPNAKTKNYTGVVTTDFSSSITGYVNGDTAAVISGSIAYTGTGATAINIGTGYVVSADVSGLTANNYTFAAGAASTLTINKAVLTVTPNPLVKTYDGTSISGLAASALKRSTVSIISGSGFPIPYGMANDGTKIFVSDGSTIKTVSFAGVLLSTHTVANLGSDYNTLCYAKGYLFARNGSSLYRISTSTWTSTLVTVDSSYPLLTGSFWSYYNVFDMPNGQIGVLGAAPNPVVRFYNVSSDGLTLTFSRDLTLNDSWTPKEVGVASDGTYLYRQSNLTGYKVYSLATGAVVYDGTSATTGWSLQDSDRGGTLSNPCFINRDHITGRYYIADWNASKFMVSDPIIGFQSTVTGYAAGDDASVISGFITYAGAAITAVNAGSYALTSDVSGLSASNYTFVAGTGGTLTINKAVLTVTPDAKSKTYDNAVFTNSLYTSTITGYVNSETSSVITGVPTYSGTAMAATGAGSYTIISAIGGMSATNYTFAPVNNTLTINKAVLTVTPNPYVKTYDATSIGTTVTLAAASALKKSTVSIASGSDFRIPYGMANDGTKLLVSDGSTIKTVSFAGVLLSTNTVANLGADGNTMCYAKGYLFARNGSSLYRISTSTWTSTLVSVDSSYPLLTGSFWSYYNVFDMPNGQIGVLGAAPNP